MDFESPDVEKDFPGLYASDASKKGNESDFSDEAHDKSFKKELIGKRKDKKDSKKDRGYAALEGESSPDEDDSKSPSKSKKSKAFKFPTKKSEKREKSREKDVKEKEKDVEKDKKKDKEKKEKDKVKIKEKKKKHGDDTSEAGEDYPVFGVPLAVAVERSGCLDGVLIPLCVRQCIDCIHQSGLNMDGLYKVAGIKSKVQSLKKAYNLREPVNFGDGDVAVATCLLKMYLRELPEPLLTNELLTRFEEAGAVKEVTVQKTELQNLVQQLPQCNSVLLAWLILHFDVITMHEKENKINAQSIAMTFSSILQMSHRLLTALLCHCKALYPDITIEKYVPPLGPGSVLPELPDGIANELSKQEALLNQIHKEMSEGFVSKSREEQLWEVQRIVTQLKRKLRSFQKTQEISTQKSVDEEVTAPVEEVKETVSAPPEESKQEASEDIVETIAVVQAVKEEVPPPTQSQPLTEQDNCKLDNTEQELRDKASSAQGDEYIWNLGLLKLQVEREEIKKLHAALLINVEKELKVVKKIQTEIESKYGSDWDDLQWDCYDDPSEYSPETLTRLEELEQENSKLEERKEELKRLIFQERAACLNLRYQINLFQRTGKLDSTRQHLSDQLFKFAVGETAVPDYFFELPGS